MPFNYYKKEQVSDPDNLVLSGLAFSATFPNSNTTTLIGFLRDTVPAEALPGGTKPAFSSV